MLALQAHHAAWKFYSKGGGFESSHIGGCVILRHNKMVLGEGTKGRRNHKFVNLHYSKTFTFTKLYISREQGTCLLYS